MFGSKSSAPKLIEIAQLSETEPKGGGGAIAMLVIGSIIMFLTAVTENSAVRLAAWGAPSGRGGTSCGALPC